MLALSNLQLPFPLDAAAELVQREEVSRRELQGEQEVPQLGTSQVSRAEARSPQAAPPLALRGICEGMCLLTYSQVYEVSDKITEL